MFEITFRAQEEDAWRLLDQLRGRGKGRILFSRATIDKTNTIKGEIRMLIITDSQQVDLAIKPVDKKGFPAQVDGVPVWATSDPTIATIEPSADGLSAVVKAATALGSVQISVSADADLGAGVETITGLLDLEVAAGKAVSLAIIAGTPTEQA